MVTNRHGISRDLLIHPGETIADLLEERSLTQKELAKRSGVSEPFLSDVIRGKKDISKGLAMGLEYALGVPGSFWLNLQANYDAELLILQEEESIRDGERTVLKSLHDVVNYLRKTAVITGSTDEQTIIQLRKHLRVSSLSVLRELAPAGAFRMSESAPINPDVLGAWLCLCKLHGQDTNTAQIFDKAKTDLLVNDLKDIMCSMKGDPQRVLKSLFARYGIDFTVMHNFRGAPVQGYIERKENGSYLMVTTLRGAYADIFWFSLFHELGHIVNGDLNKQASYVDAADSSDRDRENAADQFACDALIHPEDYSAFVKNGSFSLSSINEFAKNQNVPAYIVIGRLQKETIIPWSRFANRKPRYKWAEQ